MSECRNEAPKIIKLNVGGRVFETTEVTLKFDGCQNFFTGLLGEGSRMFSPLLDTTGALFIDRDPDYFEVILRFLRTRRFESNGHSLTALYEEALFFSLDALADHIQARMENPEGIHHGDKIVAPRHMGAYVDADDKRAIIFTSNGEREEDRRIIQVHDSKLVSAGQQRGFGIFAQAQAAFWCSSYSLPEEWDEWNREDYAEFFARFVKRGKFNARMEGPTLFLSLILPGDKPGELTRKAMAILSSDGEELLVYYGGVFVPHRFRSFGKSSIGCRFSSHRPITEEATEEEAVDTEGIQRDFSYLATSSSMYRDFGEYLSDIGRLLNVGQ